MIIERKDSKKCVEFNDVKRGEFFEWENSIYLKICDEGPFNVYDCRVNAITTFSNKIKVTPLKAKVVIE